MDEWLVPGVIGALWISRAFDAVVHRTNDEIYHFAQNIH